MTSQFTDGAPRVDRPERHVSTEAETLAKVKPIQFLCLNSQTVRMSICSVTGPWHVSGLRLFCLSELSCQRSDLKTT